MNLKAVLAGAACAVALAGVASAGTVDIAAYNGYDDTGSGMAVSGAPIATGSISSAPTGFDYNWNAPGSVGGLNAGNVFTAYFTGVLDVATTGTYAVTFGSDDASYLFLNGALAVSDGGAHGYSTSIYDVSLNAGANNFQIQYGNLYCCGAEVSLDVGPGVVVAGGVPEPATWATMILGMFGAGAVLRSRRKLELEPEAIA